MQRIGVFALLLTMCIATLAVAETELKTYPLTAPDADAMVEAVKLLAGEGGRVIHDRASSRLFVMATPAAHREIAKLLKEADVPLRNVRLEVTIDDSGKGTEAGVGTTGDGDVVITPRGTSWRARLHPFARARTSTRSGSTQQILVTRDGAEASLRVGREVPYEETLVEYGRQWGYVQRRIVMRDVGASLRFRPRVIGDGPMISLRVTPELSGMAEGERQTIQYTRAATEVTVRDGQPFTLGGFGEHSDFYSMFLIGVDKRGNQREMKITVTPHILNP